MSAPYTHTCGAVIEATERWNGCAYAVHFYRADTGTPLVRCPQCQAWLARALRDGELTDEIGRKPRDRKLSESHT